MNGNSSLIWQKYKWLIIGGITLAVVAVLVVGFVLLSDSGGSEMFAANRCPHDLKQRGDRIVAVYEGKEYGLSEEAYNWIQGSCYFDKPTPGKDFGSSSMSSSSSILSDSGRPALMNLGVKFDKYDPQTGKAGDFVFDKSSLQSNHGSNKIFFEFASSPGNGNTKLLPELTYAQIDKNADILAVLDGKVVENRLQEGTNDYAVSVVYGNNWVVNYDHLTQVKVKNGDMIKVGQVLGKPSPNRDGKTGYVEIMLKETDGRSAATAHCPSLFLAAAVKTDLEDKLIELMKDWESFYGDQNIYDQSFQVAPGCVKATMEEGSF